MYAKCVYVYVYIYIHTRVRVSSGTSEYRCTGRVFLPVPDSEVQSIVRMFLAQCRLLSETVKL